jgi:hypothetical protein
VEKGKRGRVYKNLLWIRGTLKFVITIYNIFSKDGYLIRSKI